MASLAEKELSVSPPKMGRPPIGKFTAVRLSAEMLARIDAVTEPGKRADFIRQAVERELKRRERDK
jgi:hypothetical protein